MSTSNSRRLFGISLLLAAFAAVVWWLGRGGASPTADPRGVARTEREAGPNAPRPIDAGAADDDAAPSRLPWRQAKTAVSGRILDDAGKPIAGALACAVIMQRPTPTELAREPVCARSGDDGAYVVRDLPPVRVALFATAATYQPAHYDPAGPIDTLPLAAGEETSGIDIVLRGGGVAVRGVVKDIAGGVVEGATILAQRGLGGRGARGQSLGRSDANGEFTLWVEPGEQSLRATAAGYATGKASGVAPGFTFELLLTPESVIAGRVLRDGKPVADALVSASPQTGEADNVYTDEAGRFRFEWLEPGRYKPVASAPDVYGQIPESIRLGLGQSIDDVVIEMQPSPSLRGRVLLADGTTACDRGSVAIVGRATKHRASGEIGRDGEVELLGLVADEYDVEPRCADHVAQTKYEPVVIADASVDGVTWTVEDGLVLRGKVVDGSGKPVGAVAVMAQLVSNGPGGPRAGGGGQASEPDGSFAIRGLVAGDYELRTMQDEHTSPDPLPRVTLSADTTEQVHEVRLGDGGTIEGRVVDAQQRPVRGVQVEVVGNSWWDRASTTTTDDGSFRVTSVRPGPSRVVASEARSAKRAPGTSDDDVQGTAVDVVAGRTERVELVVEAQHGTIAGRVIDADGGPVDDAFVYAVRQADSAANHPKGARAGARAGVRGGKPTLAESDGAFALDGLDVGTHTLFAMRKGGGEGVVERVETGKTDVVIQLTEGGSIAGTVALAAGGAPRRFSMTVRAAATGIERTEQFFATEGRWRFADLPEGSYELSIEAGEGSASAKYELTAGEHATGVALVLTPRVDVRGKIVDLVTGEPVAGLAVSITPRKETKVFLGAGGSNTDHISGTDGTFVVRNAPSGPVQITVTPRSLTDRAGGYDWHKLVVTIPDLPNGYELPTIRVAAARLGMTDRGGDFGFTLAEGDPELDQDKRPLELAVIRPGSPAAASELAVGDVIVEVDGHDVRGGNRYLYRPLTRVKEGTRVTFVTESGKTVSLTASKPI